jgi:hypothetical protein
MTLHPSRRRKPFLTSKMAVHGLGALQSFNGHLGRCILTETAVSVSIVMDPFRLDVPPSYSRPPFLKRDPESPAMKGYGSGFRSSGHPHCLGKHSFRNDAYGYGECCTEGTSCPSGCYKDFTKVLKGPD